MQQGPAVERGHRASSTQPNKRVELAAAGGVALSRETDWTWCCLPAVESGGPCQPASASTSRAHAAEVTLPTGDCGTVPHSPIPWTHAALHQNRERTQMWTELALCMSSSRSIAMEPNAVAACSHTAMEHTQIGPSVSP